MAGEEAFGSLDQRPALTGSLHSENHSFRLSDQKRERGGGGEGEREGGEGEGVGGERGERERDRDREIKENERMVY